ncbi:hypothetical protein NUM3379_01510 [Kineococcus sp. NUM-3379]
MDRRGFALLAGGAAAAGLLTATATATAPAAAALPVGAVVRRGTTAPRLVRSWAQAWNTGDGKLMASLFTPDGTYADHAFQARVQGTEQVAGWVAVTIDSIGDIRVTVTDVLQDGDRACVRWTFAGTFTTVQSFTTDADIRGRSFSVPAVSWFRFARGRIAAVEDHYNLADLMRQLGMDLPYTPPAG